MTFQEKLGINLHCVDAKDRFLTLLDGCTDPESKRKIIGKTFIHVFQVMLLENHRKEFPLRPLNRHVLSKQA